MRRATQHERIGRLVAPQLAADEELVGTAVVWAASRSRVPLLFRGRHRHPLALTDSRLLVFDRLRRTRKHATPMLNARLSALTLERARSRAFLYQVLADAGPNRKAVFEFSRGDQELGRTLARMLREREPAPA
jgi:hypothetical protein